MDAFNDRRNTMTRTGEHPIHKNRVSNSSQGTLPCPHRITLGTPTASRNPHRITQGTLTGSKNQVLFLTKLQDSNLQPFVANGRHNPPSSRYNTPGFVMATLKLCVYHMLNVIFAFAGCGILSAGICTAASLIPVCCIGLLIFQVLVYIVLSLAQWDIKLGNYIAPAHQCANPNLFPPGRHIGREGMAGYRISPSLTSFSPLSLMAMLYFVLVKPAIGALSLLSVLLVVAPTVSVITSLTSYSNGTYYESIQIYGVGPTSMSRNPGMSLVGAICVTLLGVALMQLVAKISLGATRFFCCEKFAVTTRYPHYQYQPFSQNGTTTYGTTMTRS
ncbi:hypothetical protein PHMEG_00031892 [Phytophthora megakarya]|uniref:Transmembrane protein n=1 Tax=Phytophthora megakarya TaxID=4795 RepID=A0A225UX87_9STRA|nr:hypothetical protein PHMEG_00031892 [Phytophthora megakarya]